MPILATIVALGLASCSGNKIEALKQENEELRQEVERLKLREKAHRAQITEENLKMYSATLPELDEEGWQPVTANIEIHAHTFPMRDGEFSVVRSHQKMLFFGEPKKKSPSGGVVLSNRPFGVRAGDILNGSMVSIISMFTKTGTLELMPKGKFRSDGPSALRQMPLPTAE